MSDIGVVKHVLEVGFGKGNGWALLWESVEPQNLVTDDLFSLLHSLTRPEVSKLTPEHKIDSQVTKLSQIQ